MTTNDETSEETTQDNEVKILSNNTAVGKYNVTDAAIQKMKDDFLPLKINGLEDKTTYDLVYNSRVMVKKTIAGIEKTRKELKAPVLQRGKDIDAEADRITAELEIVKTHLEKEESEYERLKQAKKDEEAKQKQELIKARVGLLTAAGMHFDGINYILEIEQVMPGDPESITVSWEDIGKLSEKEFSDVLIPIQKAHANQEEIKAAEKKRLEDLATELETTKAKLAETETALKKAEENQQPSTTPAPVMKAEARPLRFKFEEIPASLTYENFWNVMTERYPDQVKKYGDWIDEYKKRVEWKTYFEHGATELDDRNEFKYHDIPLAMQMGIFMQYVVECGSIFYLVETMHDAIDQVEMHFLWMIDEGK